MDEVGRGSHDLWQALVGDGASWRDVDDRYGEAHRTYHTLAHVDRVLETLAELEVSEPAVLLAAVLHDVVYDPTRTDNEELSARYAARALAALDPAVATRAGDLIRATAAHDQRPTADRGRAALLDADLAVLGAPPEEYGRYAAAIRQEHAHVVDAAYRSGRAAVLQGFLDRPRLYATEELHEALDAPARANLRREIAVLRAT